MKRTWLGITVFEDGRKVRNQRKLEKPLEARKYEKRGPFLGSPERTKPDWHIWA